MSDEPWRPMVSELLGAEMSTWATLLRDGAAKGFATTASLAKPPKSGSPLDLEVTRLRETKPQWPTGVLQAVAADAGRYLCAAGRHVLAIADLLDSREAVLSLFPLLRAELEACGRSGWFLESLSPDREPVSPEARVARHHMDYLASLCRRRYSASKRGDSTARQREIKQERDAVRRQITSLFPDAQLSWNFPGDENQWVCEGQSYAGLGSAIDIFLGVASPEVRGIYDALSDFSHPSLATIRDLTTEVEISNLRAFAWKIESDVLVRQVQVSGALFGLAASMLASYLASPESKIDEWLDTFDQALQDQPT